MFDVGQRVKYTGGGTVGNNIIPGCNRLTRGTVYTVRALDARYIPYHGHPGVLVHEVKNTRVEWAGEMWEPCKVADNFVPISERETDISIFTSMLSPSHQREPV